MRTRSNHLLSIVALLGVVACDPKADPEGMTTTTASDTTDGQTTDGETGDTTGDTTGATTGEETIEPEGCTPPGGDGFTCTADEDCEIAGDCCSCTAYNPNEGAPGNCGGACDMNKCEEWGVIEAACQNGQCVPKGLSCNQALVTCDALAPLCDGGTLPRVADGCFTGDCLAIEACDWVPSCDVCSGDQACMHESRGGCDYDLCVGPIAECQGQAPCACLGQIFCDGQCSPTAEGFTCQ